MKNFTKWIILFCILFSGIQGSLFAAETGTIKGVVIDTITGDRLPGATIAIKKQSLGTYANANGEFILNNVPAGSNTLTISYLGYKTQELVVSVSAKETKIINLKLEVLANQVAEVVVSTQARGQRAAINQQLASTTISNVISSEKMRELPDANAAEAIGRLPGVSLTRNSGEADKVVVRGLSPKYSNITLEGIKLVSTDINDRSVDLSMVQSESLSGVDVSKSLRADLDAEALGGTVNLQLGKAADSRKSELLLQGSYANMTNTYKNYKVSGLYSDRYLNKKLGVSLRLSNELKQLPLQEFDGGYSGVIYDSKLKVNYLNTEGATLKTQSQARMRSNAAVILDYQNSWWDVRFLNLLSWKNDRVDTYSDEYRFLSSSSTGGEEIRMKAVQAFWRNFTRSHILKNTFTFGNSKIDVTLAKTFGLQNENDYTFPLTQTGVWPQLLAKNLTKIRNKQPSHLVDTINGSANWNPANTYLNSVNVNGQRVITRADDVRLDYELSYSFFNFISGKFKAGLLYHAMNRESNAKATALDWQWSNSTLAFDYVDNAYPDIKTGWIYNDRGLSSTNLVEKGYAPPKFLNGEYKLGNWRPDLKMLVYGVKSVYGGPNDKYFKPDPTNMYNKVYNAIEDSRDGYVETELKIGSHLMVLPGIRYESYTTKYSGYTIKAIQTGIEANPPFITIARFHKNWFPSVNMKYKVNDDISIQGAVYKSTSKPDYNQVSPIIVYPNGSGYMVGGNPYLNPSSAVNYDIAVSYSNKNIGLLTVSAFYKEIDDLIFNINGYKPLYSKTPGNIGGFVKGAPSDFNQRILNESYFQRAVPGNYLNLPVNNPNKAYDKGLELSWQTSFWYLPGLLKGFVLDVNYTIIRSSTLYPYIYFPISGYNGTIPLYDNQVYGTRKGLLMDQPNSILNIILGWDYKGFSSRISYRYQTQTVTGIDGTYSLKDSYYAPFSLLDLNLNQKINKYISCFANMTNINNHIDRNYFNRGSLGNFPTTEQYYGYRIDVGIKCNL